MKKAAKLLGFGIFFLAAILVTAVFVQAGIESSKDSYLTTDSVYARSTFKLCNNLPNGVNVTLYIVENQDEWFEGDVLEDVRAGPREVPNSQFSSIKIWEMPIRGVYDIIIDCIGNGKYDALEPIDGLFNVGFSVAVIAGTCRAEIGKNDVGNHFWMYDSEDPDLINEMLQLSLLAKGEDVTLENMTIQASGNGNDTGMVIEIYLDENNNGRVDTDEFLIAESEYLEDNGKISVLLDYALAKDTKETLLVSYVMEETAAEGEFSLIVKSIYGIGESSGEVIKLSGLPISSGTNTILPEKKCLESLSLELPSSAVINSTVIAKISGLSGCQGKKVVLRANPCGSSIKEEISSCTIGEEGAGCEISFTALASKTYYACIDKNKDGDMVDFGEYAFEDLIVEGKPVVVGNVTERINITEGENITEENIIGGKDIIGEQTGEPSGVTGGVVDELKERLSETGSFFILLEITLLLILFVLIMILFKLRSPVIPEKEKETEEEEED